MTKPVVDIDDRATWPPHVSNYVDEWDRRLRGTTSHAYDLAIPHEQRDSFLRMLDGYLIRAYHATRLLEHERDLILRQGMRALSAGLMIDRINGAHAVGALSDEERDRFLRSHAFAVDFDRDGVENRKDRVCLVFSRSMFDYCPHGFSDLLDTWGGEGLVSYLGWDSIDRRRLQSLGRASIVVAQLDVSAGAGRDYITPSLDRAFVGKALDLDECGAEIHFMRDIPSDCIEAIWQPDHYQYARHKRLPER